MVCFSSPGHSVPGSCVKNVGRKVLQLINVSYWSNSSSNVFYREDKREISISFVHATNITSCDPELAFKTPCLGDGLFGDQASAVQASCTLVDLCTVIAWHKYKSGHAVQVLAG